MKKLSYAASAAAAALLLGLSVAPAASAHPQHGHARAIPFTHAEVTAADDGSYEITWNAPGTRHVQIRANGKVVAEGAGQGKATVRGLPTADRQWFDLVPSRGGSLRLADRLVKLSGTVNFRDAGGYRTTSGQWVRMGEIYRSDALDKLTADDLAELRRLGIRTVFDLRMEKERTDAPDRVPAGAQHVVADVFAGSPAFTTLPKTAAEAEQAMIDAEQVMVSGTGAKSAYSKVFQGFGDNGRGSAVLFHCTAGKDRTGWSNAALLTALGVPRETVMADYLASNDYRKAANEATLAHLPADQAKVYKPLLDVRAEYLNSGFEEVRDSYGSFRTYLNKGIGVDGRELRELKRELLVG